MGQELILQMATWLLGVGVMIAVLIAMLLKHQEYTRVIANADAAALWRDLVARIEIAERELVNRQQELHDLEAVKLESATENLKLESRRQELQRVEEEIESLRNNLARMDELRLELTRIQTDLQASREQLADVRQERQAFEEKAAIAQALAKGAQVELQQLQERASSVRAAVEADEARRAEVSRELGTLQASLAEIRAHLVSAGEAKADLQRQLDELRANNAKAERYEAELHSSTVALEEKNRLLLERHNTMLQTVDEIKLALDDLIAKHAEAEREITSTRGNLAKVVQALNESKQMAEKTRLEHDRLLAALGEIKGQIAGMQYELKSLEKSINSLEEIERNLKQTSTAAPVDPHQALQDLAQPVLLREFIEKGTKFNEQDALDQLDDYLTKRGLRFPQRVRLAFHTSLKVAEISPLVTLAGVSGTGKSALPEAYAAALGMNFLSLAVQPGWSGPQDLLGFYNYLEKKYKATDLARALAQMSPYAKEDLKGVNIKSRADQMLLVLLDEMNLARVEYYFSEFLSRLEQRRGKDPSKLEVRRQVSIPIELAALPEGESSRHIYVGHNVLFVGTMNEDESTQSLSDKVVDRANVLRFGAPAKLEHLQQSQNGSHSTSFLPESVWRSWLKKGDLDSLGQEKNEVDNTLRELNRCLEDLGRPFAHRVYQAMLTYICNYPGAPDRKAIQAALSDQLEQKIFPKLRGIETDRDGSSECLEHLGKIVASLGDRDLENAFRKSRQGSLFEWNGVKRAAE